MPRRRPKRLRARPPALAEDLILAWAEDHRALTGRWPTQASGPVRAALAEDWHALDVALRDGYRGLPGGSSLAQLLAARRGTRNKKRLPHPTEGVILPLADVHRWWTGAWPTRNSGAVLASPVPGETWKCLNDALVEGLRGLAAGSSLARLLARGRGAPNRKALPRLSERRIVSWADDHSARTGRWPTEKAGQVLAAPGEARANLSAALREGTRGLPGGSSLHRLPLNYGRGGVVPPTAGAVKAGRAGRVRRTPVAASAACWVDWHAHPPRPADPAAGLRGRLQRRQV